MTQPPAVEVRAVSKSFGTFRALRSVSFAVGSGEFFTMLGPSGCGKTTLLRMLAGFESPDGGGILLHGRPVGDVPPHRRRVNTVFQSYALFPHMSVEQNVAFGLENLGWDRARVRARVGEMLERVHMGGLAARRPAHLSGGQRQRVALARALAPDPEVLLLDEPLSALDLKLRQAMRDELRALQRDSGITFVFVTHDQEEALDLSDRIAVLGGGEVQQIGTPAEIYDEPVNRFVADFVGATNLFDVEVLDASPGQATVRTPFGAVLTVPQSGGARGRATLSIRPERIGLGDEAPAQHGIALEGRVVARNYLGGLTHYTLDVGGVPLRASRRNAAHGGDAIAVGSTVPLGFAAASARVLAA